MIHSFLDFELDETLFELRQRGKPVEVQARVFATLLCLVRNRGRIITRDELTQSVWKDTVVSDTAISQVVMLARKALGDGGVNPQIIRTIRGRGFRFAPPVSVRQSAPPPAPDLPLPAASTPATSPQSTPLPAALEPASHVGFVGRQEELARLMQCLERAGRGRGGLVLLEGEPGSGRSSLVRELARRAALRNVEAIWGRTWETHDAPPFWPFTAVLRALVQRHGIEQLRALMGDHANDLAPIYPELAKHAAARRELADTTDVQVRFRLFAALSRVLRAVSLESGAALLIILEDVHSADPASLQLLRYLSEEVADMPVLLVVTLDELAPHVAERLTKLLPWTATHLHRVSLRGLSRLEVTGLLESKLGSPPAAALADSLYELSAGNPLLVHTLIERLTLQPDGTTTFSAWDLAAHPVPERIVAAVRQHLADLPSHTLRALSAAAALGCEFRVPWLAALIQMSEAELLEALAPALRRFILRANSPQLGAWSFTHGMVRNAIYTGLAVRERFELHQRIAALIESYGADEPGLLGALAHHYLLAGPGEARDKAILYGRKAGEHAAQQQAYADAGQLFDRALDVVEVSLEAQPEQRHELAQLAGDAFYRAGQLRRASARFARAAASIQERSPEQHATALGLSVLVLRGLIPSDTDTTLALQRALTQLPPGPSRARVLLMAASALGQPSRAAREAQTTDALAQARQLGDAYALAWALYVRHAALWGSTPPAELLPIASEMVELARAHGDAELLLDGQLWRMVDR
ncbi:MAG: AAA family ATPase, partial [Polyangiales bacterium]